MPPQLPKRDYLRVYLAMARECYDLAATPAPNALYRQAVDDGAVGYADYDMPTDARRILLQIGIDVRCIVLTHLAELESNHGDKRAIRLAEWIETGTISHLSYWKRQELFHDRKMLGQKIRKYRAK